jgi:F0F1-type ATP synthase membrane subunit b/b'
LAEKTAQAVQQNITNAAIKAENVIKSANTQASQLIGSTLTTIQQMAQDVGNRIQALVQTGRNIRACVSEQSDAVRRVLPVAGMTASLALHKLSLRPGLHQR